MIKIKLVYWKKLNINMTNFLIFLPRKISNPSLVQGQISDNQALVGPNIPATTSHPCGWAWPLTDKALADPSLARWAKIREILQRSAARSSGFLSFIFVPQHLTHGHSVSIEWIAFIALLRVETNMELHIINSCVCCFRTFYFLWSNFCKNWK